VAFQYKGLGLVEVRGEVPKVKNKLNNININIKNNPNKTSIHFKKTEEVYGDVRMLCDAVLVMHDAVDARLLYR
jgi:hypothetical protein